MGRKLGLIKLEDLAPGVLPNGKHCLQGLPRRSIPRPRRVAQRGERHGRHLQLYRLGEGVSRHPLGASLLAEMQVKGRLAECCRWTADRIDACEPLELSQDKLRRCRVAALRVARDVEQPSKRRQGSRLHRRVERLAPGECPFEPCLCFARVTLPPGGFHQKRCSLDAVHEFQSVGLCGDDLPEFIEIGVDGGPSAQRRMAPEAAEQAAAKHLGVAAPAALFADALNQDFPWCNAFESGGQ